MNFMKLVKAVIHGPLAPHNLWEDHARPGTLNLEL
jgi:hypothetical protein